MSLKERNQNPVCEDTVVLRLYQFNENAAAAVDSIEKVEIYEKPAHGCNTPPAERRLVQTITTITVDAVGQYSVTVPLTSPLYVPGRYTDEWHIRYQADQCPGTRAFEFVIGTDKWYANHEPFLWEFAFAFRPFRFRKNERKNIVVEVTPNVPHISDLDRYYASLTSYPSVFVNIEMRCGDCIPAEVDLRTVVDRAAVTMTSSKLGRYFLDTTDLDCGIYDIWFELDMGGNTYISPRNQLQIS